jgi:hypothetical protein
MGHVTGRCLVKFSEGPTVIVGTHDTTFTLCSGRPHRFFIFKCTARILRRSTYVLFTPPQLSWQLNLWCCAGLCATRRCCCVVCNCIAIRINSGINAMASIFALLSYSTISVWSRTVGKEGLFTCRAKHVLTHLCEVRSECDGVWPIPARHVFNTNLTENATRRVTDEGEAHSARRQRSDKTRQERRQAGENWVGCQDRRRGINRTAVYSGGKFKLEN